MKNTKFGLLSLGLVGSLSLGCSEVDDGYDDVTERNAEIVENLIEAGFAEGDIEIREAESVVLTEGGEALLGSPEPQVFVDGDVHMTLGMSREMLDGGEGDGTSFRHWRTPNIVNNNNMICLAKVTTGLGGFGSYVLTDAMDTGVNRAKDNYNALGSVGLDFKVGNATLNADGTLTHAIGGCDFTIFVYKVNGGAGGSAGFPSGGAPYNQVQLNSGLSGYSVGVHEHVATHEIGHAIGMRHTDWKTRSSCGQNTNEGKSGAIRISGTADQTTNSIMASCFGGSENGNFKGEDAEAFNKLY